VEVVGGLVRLDPDQAQADLVDRAMLALAPEQRRLVENPGASLGDLAGAFSV